MSDRADLTVRPIEAGDETEWCRLWTGYLDFYETSVSEEVYQTPLSRLLSSDPQDHQGCPSVCWLTQEFDAGARQLYDRVGTLTPFIGYDRRLS
ncbi:hypothetical protein [Aliiruegeria lutimaris]|uniref:GNAT family N-acetyltransferase n=1 Tax=Aliiruegeria lutimaris TaxID=571298 RepID=A0A1G9CFQ6_9RHOB|nr:hypothetical protein [Aliiruegeria lutimaris]SDK50482.1 hypothetical protein SAMN04488026_104325 [Aliiruegeria lutimaris]